jgi:hypothetical protein
MADTRKWQRLPAEFDKKLSRIKPKPTHWLNQTTQLAAIQTDHPD